MSATCQRRMALRVHSQQTIKGVSDGLEFGQGARKRDGEKRGRSEWNLLLTLGVSAEEINGYVDWTLPNQAIMSKIYGYYTSTFLANSNRKWAGMAKMAGNAVWNGLKTIVKARQYVPVIGVDITTVQTERALVKMNLEIFQDLGWVHEAYTTGGIEEIRALAAAGEIDDKVAGAFEDIYKGTLEGNDDLVNQGNTALLRREQEKVLRDGYAFLSKMGIGVAMGALTESPIPGGNRFMRLCQSEGGQRGRSAASPLFFQTDVNRTVGSFILISTQVQAIPCWNEKVARPLWHWPCQ